MTSLLKRAARVFGIGLTLCLCAGAIYWLVNTPDKSMRGVWRSDGYGLLVDISALTIDIYEVSPAESCLHWVTLPANMDLANRFAGYSFSTDGDSLTIQVAEITNDVHAKPVPSLPDACSGPSDTSPRKTLDVFLSTFSQHYPNFALYDVDWSARVASANDQFEQNAPLDQIMRDALFGLDDDHVEITFGDKSFRPKADPAWSSDRRKYFDVGAAYLESPLTEWREAGLYHGWLPDGIGYIAIVHMGSQPSPWRLPVDQARLLTQQLSDTYSSANAIILDLRYNSGGSDTLALAYASLLSDTPWLGGRKAVKMTPDSYGAFVDVQGDGTPNALTIPAAVLTSSYTVSAAEIGVLALRELPNVTTIGENTAGALSDMMERQLPNGWAFTLPHQVYESPDGLRFEGVGIPPDIAVSMNINAFSDGKDQILEAAIAELKKQ